MVDEKEFRGCIEEADEKYGISDCIYNGCIKEFSKVKISQLNQKHEIRILRPFLLTWGGMRRFLGYSGVQVIPKKLNEINQMIEPLRCKDFRYVDLDQIKDLIINLFDVISKTNFKNKKGVQKDIGSTTTSKILHLTCPDLFIMWDSAIRDKYKKHKDGKGYFDFLKEMKSLWEELKPTIQDLMQRFGKRATKIIDEYNWMITHPQP